MRRIRVLTLNLLNVADRWPERMPVLHDEFAALRPDVAGLQEVYYPIDQERLVSGEGAGYAVRRAWADRPERGNSLLIGPGLAAGLEPLEEPGRRSLGHGRSALRVELTTDALRLRLVVSHLHHVPVDESIRDRQVALLLDWLGEQSPADVTIVTGDFNAEPDEIAAQRMREAGFRSAHAEATGADPERTFPSGLQAPGREEYIGWPEGCIDYVWIDGRVRAVAGRICFDRPAPNDPTLYASDHRGVLVELELG